MVVFWCVSALLGRLSTSFWLSWDGFGSHFGSLGASWGALVPQIGPSWPKIAKKVDFFSFDYGFGVPSWTPKSRKIDENLIQN